MDYGLLPKELKNIIFEFDGSIKYRNNEIIPIIHKYDKRYTILKEFVEAKIQIYYHAVIDDENHFYLSFSFKGEPLKGLCVSSGDFTTHSNKELIETCYFNFKNNYILQDRSYI